jgi:hypothetical protein
MSAFRRSPKRVGRKERMPTMDEKKTNERVVSGMRGKFGMRVVSFMAVSLAIVVAAAMTPVLFFFVLIHPLLIRDRHRVYVDGTLVYEGPSYGYKPGPYKENPMAEFPAENARDIYTLKPWPFYFLVDKHYSGQHILIEDVNREKKDIVGR